MCSHDYRDHGERQGTRARCRARDAPAVGASRNARIDRHQVRLRHRRLRRLHGPDGRPGSALVHAAGVGGHRQKRDHDRRARAGWRAAPGAARVGRPSGAAVRLLPVRHDHGCCRAPRADSESDGRGDRCRADQRLPLRDVRARPHRHPRRRRRHGRAVMKKWTRRTFIGAGTVAGGGFLLGVAGFTFAPSRHSLVSADAAEKGQLTTWITIAPDNSVAILIPHCEMGQGTPTALAMMAAEELEADWSLVRVHEAPALDAYANGYIVRAAGGHYVPAILGRGVDYGAYKIVEWYGLMVTGGSTAVRGTGEFGMRVAGAAAKEMLLAAAAQQWGVNAAECTAKRSHVVHAASGRTAAFGELARSAARQPVPTSPALKGADRFTIR